MILSKLKKFFGRGRPQSRVIYQTWGVSEGPLHYIDKGYTNALRAMSGRVVEWDPSEGAESLIRAIRRVRPNLLMLNLQTLQRTVAPWATGSVVPELLRLKGQFGFRVACRSSPSNLSDLFSQFPLDFAKYTESGVSSFYLQPEHPTPEETLAVTSGLIDLVRTAFAYESFDIGFRNYLDLGLRILEEPHAADTHRYTASSHPSEFAADILFVGGCWPFKWDNMKRFVLPMKKRFGKRFRIYGRNWPDNLSLGILPDSEFNSAVCSSQINLTMHELSQTLPQPLSGNERIYKLGLLGTSVLSDNNAVLEGYFDPYTDLGLCSDGDEMVSRSETLLSDENARRASSEHLRRAVLERHTYETRLLRLLAVLDESASVNRYV